MTIIPVHTLTRKAIIYQYGSDTIHVDRARHLLPLLTSAPAARQTTDFSATIRIEFCDTTIPIRADAGHNLYAFHMQQIIDYMNVSVANDRPALTAMKEFYNLLGLDLDDLPPERTYKRWQRAQQLKKCKKSLYFHSSHVLKNISQRSGTLNECMATAGRIINQHPDIFLTGAGLPDPHMVQKIMMHAMHQEHGWTQKRIAETFNTTQANVSMHLTSIKAILKGLES